ncbi:homoserine kinase [Tanacetum coccineum]
MFLKPLTGVFFLVLRIFPGHFLRKPGEITGFSFTFTGLPDSFSIQIGDHGDYITLKVDPTVQPGQTSIFDISSTSCLSKNTLYNSAGIAAIIVMKMLNLKSVKMSLSLEKGLPLRSGLGSSAASAAADVVAVNEIFGRG